MDGEVGNFIRRNIEKVGLVPFEAVWDNGFRHRQMGIRSLSHRPAIPCRGGGVLFEGDLDRVRCTFVDGAALQESDLVEWSKERLAGYKRPRSYSFIAESEMPRNATGKVLHRELKKKFMD
jgi:hypothetical protein